MPEKADAGKPKPPKPPNSLRSAEESSSLSVAASGVGRGSSLARLRAGLARSADRLGAGLAALAGRGRLDEAAFDALEACLLEADIGLATVDRILADWRREGVQGPMDWRRFVADRITASLAAAQKPCRFEAPEPEIRPRIMLVVGVNGSGKTTLIGKLARRYRRLGQKTALVAGDAFRAAATEQLQRWGEAEGVPVMAGEPGADASGLVYRACDRGRAEGFDSLLIDTAGRLHNKTTLMEALAKMNRVVKRWDASAPHETLLVLDAAIGLNSLRQAEAFTEAVGVTGLAVNKLDGSARGGALLPIVEKTGLPVYYLGVGEGGDDLTSFVAADFAATLVGLDRGVGLE